VDDEQKTAQLFHSALNTLKGINVFEFTDPILALEHLKINKLDYAVMISDLRMPVINGVQLLKTVKDLNPSTRTILMTGYDFDNNLPQRVHKKRNNRLFSKKANRTWSITIRSK
jgi:DNA-binding NtrC family response regulator